VWEIVVCGTRSEPLAGQLKHDKTHLLDQWIEDTLGRLDNEVRKARSGWSWAGGGGGE
jgi:hypothetical protein